MMTTLTAARMRELFPSSAVYSDGIRCLAPNLRLFRADPDALAVDGEFSVVQLGALVEWTKGPITHSMLPHDIRNRAAEVLAELFPDADPVNAGAIECFEPYLRLDRSNLSQMVIVGTFTIEQLEALYFWATEPQAFGH